MSRDTEPTVVNNEGLDRGPDTRPTRGVRESFDSSNSEDGMRGIGLSTKEKTGYRHSKFWTDL